jgi:hypothetical protein
VKLVGGTDRLKWCTMPTSKPRIQITLNDDAYRALSRYSKLTSQSMSSVASECLSPFLSELDQISDLVEKLKTMEAGRKEQLIQAMDNGQAEGEVREVLESFVGKAFVRAMLGDPLLTNRGVDTE